MFHSYFERKYDKVLTFNIVHFPNFEISASLLLAPPSNNRCTNQGALISGNTVRSIYVLYSVVKIAFCSLDIWAYVPKVLPKHFWKKSDIQFLINSMSRKLKFDCNKVASKVFVVMSGTI